MGQPSTNGSRLLRYALTIHAEPSIFGLPPKRFDHLEDDESILLNLNRSCLLAFLLVLVWAPYAQAQELEPRRWSHLPMATNFHGAGYAYTDGDLSFDPVLKIENATVKMHTVVLKYIRPFELLGRSARVDLAGAYQNGTWKGTLDGVATQVERNGWADPVVRFAVNLYGAPPLEGEAFANYRAKQTSKIC